MALPMMVAAVVHANVPLNGHAGSPGSQVTQARQFILVDAPVCTSAQPRLQQLDCFDIFPISSLLRLSGRFWTAAQTVQPHMLFVTAMLFVHVKKVHILRQLLKEDVRAGGRVARNTP